MHRARAARPRGFDSLPSQDPDPGRCPLSFSAGSSKNKIRTSSRHKANLALWRDEVRILSFDDPAENGRGQRPEFRSAQLYSNNTTYYNLVPRYLVICTRVYTCYSQLYRMHHLKLFVISKIPVGLQGENASKVFLSVVKLL